MLNPIKNNRMKNLILTLFILSFTFNCYPQSMEEKLKELESTVAEDTIRKDTVKTKKKDTTHINFKNKKVRITEDKEGTTIEVKKKGESEWDFDDDDWDDFENDDHDGFNLDFMEDKGFDIHWAGFEIGMNNFLNNNYSMNLSEENEYLDLNTGKSWNINLNFIEYDLNVIGKNFGIGSGLGLEFMNFRFDSRVPVTKGEDDIMVDSAYIKEGLNLDKGKLSTTFLTLPLLMEFQAPAGQRNKFFITVGVIGGLKLGSHTKVVYKDENGNRQKDKNQSDLYISPLKLGYTLRMGYGAVKVFGNYYETGLFEKGKGPTVHPFSVGLMVSF